MPVEKEFRQKIKEAKTEQNPLAEKLVLSFKARAHFAEAIDWALKTPGADVSNALVKVADNMSEADIEPVMILDTLLAIRDGRMPDKNKGIVDIGISKVEALLGYESRDYLRLAETKFRKHEDPSPILLAAVERLSKNRLHYDPEGRYSVNDLSKIGTLLFKTGHYPNTAFDKAEEIIPKIEINVDECKLLSREYANCGLFDDAIRIVGAINNLRHKLRYARPMLENIARKQTEAGKFEDAINTALRIKSPLFTAEIMAKKAVKESEQGADPSQSITKTQAILDMLDEKEGQAEIYSLIFVAQIKSGKIEDAKETLGLTESLISNLDSLYKSDAEFALGNAVDDAGFDATEFYKKGFSYADEFAKAYPDWCEMFGMEVEMYENGIKFLINKGYFDLAKEYIDKISDRRAPMGIATLVAELAKNEAREGLSQEEIDNLSKEDIKAILEGENEAAKEAVVYFGLDKKI